MKLKSIRILTIALALLAISSQMFAQTHQVTGRVLDASNGEPVIGAGVVASNGGGTVTDYDGNYVISVSSDATLTFSSIGYKTVTEQVGDRARIDINLQPDNLLLDEVVVLGYTSQKKAELTSAVVSMSGEKLTDVTAPDVGNMLQGKVAGVVAMNASGQPGDGADIRIRGTGSINAGAGPLYVVDGVAGGSFNPNDIETLTVLKDASATALYGAAAAGGVIVVTTKSAKSDKSIINFKASAGIKRALSGRFKTMDSYELYDFYSTIYAKSKIPAPAYDALENQNFNWIDNCFKTGVVQNYFASASGKAGKVGYYVSLDHYNEQGSMINTGYKRNAARINLSAPISEKLLMNVRLNYKKEYSDYECDQTREACYVMLPFDVPYVKDADGNYTNEPLLVSSARRSDGGKWYSSNTYNVFHSEKYCYNKSHSEGIVGDLQFIWNVTDWLTLTSTNRYDSSNIFSEKYYDPGTTLGAPDGELVNSDGEWNGWGTTNLAKFHKSFSAHDVSAIVGWEYGEGYSRDMGASGNGMPSGQRSLNNTIMTGVSGSDYHSRSWALLSQAQYSYLGKYILTASLRYDESYKFGPLNRGGFFPGASAAWIISNEDFLKNSAAFSFLKLRAGYGKTGNDNIEPFQYQDTFALTAQYNNVVSAFLERRANYNLGWEEAYMASIGVDATLFNNWNITLDAYHTINSNLLLDRPLPPSTGFFSVMDNVGKVRNMGIEFAADGAIIKNRNFVWTAGINLGVNQNRVLELPEHKEINNTKVEVTQLIKEGLDIYSWYMPKWVGVDVETGRPLWEHLEYDEDGNVTETTYVDTYGDATPQVVGSASPWFSGGLNTAVSWKGFTLSATGSFVVGNKIYNRTRQHILDTDGAKGGFNQQSFDNGLGWIRWKKGDPDGTNAYATHPQAINGGNSQANEYSSRYLEDGSFFRLRNITLSYDLPQNLVSKIKMSSARVYVSADNIFTYTRFSGMDPEVRLESTTWSLAGLYADNYPVPMSIVMGLDINF
ncbi:MAG: SusC/RagA family TonB-linked outer membrane protein [Bacteroidales bacterium]|nr:SusC/RagA family TonB-linked outer membrane protein [Bacteroidales bacterium]